MVVHHLPKISVNECFPTEEPKFASNFQKVLKAAPPTHPLPAQEYSRTKREEERTREVNQRQSVVSTWVLPARAMEDYGHFRGGSSKARRFLIMAIHLVAVSHMERETSPELPTALMSI